MGGRGGRGGISPFFMLRLNAGLIFPAVLMGFRAERSPHSAEKALHVVAGVFFIFYL